jgi:NTP pyrophosphatase (non-canonical NTP hydrolase)
MASVFHSTDSFKDFQTMIRDIYGLIDGRGYSTWDLMSNTERYTLRALKGIRKSDVDRVRLNLLIAISWAGSLGNRLRFDMEDDLWKRFPYQCSYCAGAPCVCKEAKPHDRPKLTVDESKRPKNLNDYQVMFEAIYPSNSRTLVDVGIHLAEEVGEISEAIHIYLGEHQPIQLEQIRLELADYFSCVFGVANSTPFNIAEKLSKMYKSGCPICKHDVCDCTFSVIAGHIS